MKKLMVADLAEIIQARCAYPGPAVRNMQRVTPAFTGVSTDSRTTQPGDCFFAIPGENFDGHDYVADAFAKGAACAVVNKDFTGQGLTESCLLRVNDTINALGDLAREYRRQAGFKVVAITGSVGKTTTRQITYHLLGRRYRVFQSPKSFNNQIGLPLTLLGADPEHQIVIAELGTNHPGEIAYLTGIAQPNIAVVTNVHPAHLEGLGDLQAVTQEKLSISEGLTPDGLLIINGDLDRLVDACQAKGVAFLSFGRSDGLDYQARDICLTGSGSTFTIGGTRIDLPLPGPGNVENALASWAICSQFDLTADDLAKALKTLPSVSMRAELLQVGTLTVLDDCYNANPASMRNALQILVDLGSAGNRRLVFVCGDMAELGQQTETLHAELGLLIAEAKVQLLLTVGKLARVAAEAARKISDLQIECFEDTVSLCDNLAEFAKDGDIILVKGSRIAGLEMVVEKLRQLFE